MSSLIEPSQFKPLMMLRENWQVMRDECVGLDRDDILDIDRENRTHRQVADALIRNGRVQWVKAWGDQKDRWLNWGFAINDEYPFDYAATPKTVRLLRKVKGLRVAALSLFKPGVRLPLHDHPELGRERILTFHLGLECPPNCYLYADGQFTLAKDGVPIVFDGSRPHYAVNASNSDRLILYCEFSPERVLQ